LDEVFAQIQAIHEMDVWLEEHREAAVAQIEEGFAESERGELLDAEEVAHILHEDRAQRKSA
jgi:predicted transcriptional regulator